MNKKISMILFIAVLMMLAFACKDTSKKNDSDKTNSIIGTDNGNKDSSDDKEESTTENQDVSHLVGTYSGEYSYDTYHAGYDYGEWAMGVRSNGGGSLFIASEKHKNEQRFYPLDKDYIKSDGSFRFTGMAYYNWIEFKGTIKSDGTVKGTMYGRGEKFLCSVSGKKSG